jgi:HYR domain/Bacterial Ig domain/Bacterial cadherin-like domain
MLRPAPSPRTGRRAITFLAIAALLAPIVGVATVRAATLANFPTSTSTILGVWANPSSAYANDGVSTQANLAWGEQVSQSFGTFGFDAIPVGSTINSVSVSAEFHVSSAAGGDSVSVRAFVSGVASGSAAVDASAPTTDTTISTASTGITSRSQLLDGTLTVRVADTRPASGGPASTSLFVDFVRVDVDYTAPDSPPVLDPIGDQTLDEGTTLNVSISASDPDGDAITFFHGALPSLATFTDNGDGTASLVLAPGFSDAGSYPLTIGVLAGGQNDSESITIAVVDAFPPPVLDPIGDQTVAEGATLNVAISAFDPDGDAITYFHGILPSFATFTDNGDGTASLALAPGFGDAGSYPLTIGVLAGGASDSEAITITVTHTDQPPVLDPISDQTVAEGAALSVNLSASDPDGDGITYFDSGLPSFATLTDHGDGTATLGLAPGFTDAGSYPVLIGVVAGTGNDSETFTITVTDTNRPPVLDPIGPITVEDGFVRVVTITANDPDGDPLTITAGVMPPFMSLVDNGDGTATLTLSPAPSDIQPPFNVLFVVEDPDGLSDDELVTITVVDLDVPVVTVPADMTVEATSASGAVVAFSASATDAVDGPLVPTCNPPSGNTFALGGTTVICSATDSHGNTDSGLFTITVVDTTAPTVTVPTDIAVVATGPSDAIVDFVVSATDLVDGSLSPTCAPPSGSTFPIGTTTVTCSVTDNAGNTGEASFAVVVSATAEPTPTGSSGPAVTPPATDTAGAATAGDQADGPLAFAGLLLGFVTIAALALAVVPTRRRET